MDRIKCSDSRVIHFFTNCKWTDCKTENDNGPAIFSNTAGVKLSVERCIFTDCYCEDYTNTYGGIVFVSSISSLTVKNSFFEYTKESPQTRHGGAIKAVQVPSMTIHDDTFSKCYAFTDGGGVDLVSCSTEDDTKKVINNCYFLQCRSKEGSGGGVCAMSNQYNNLITNSIFSHCSSVYGGGLYLFYSSYSPSSSTSEEFPVQFCFFNRNFLSSSDAWGNDATFESNGNYIPADDQPILLHCFSTSESFRVGYYADNKWSITDVNWLIQSNLSFIVLFSNELHTD